MTTKDVKSFLNKIKMLNKRIENMTEERTQLLALATGTTAQLGSERVQSSGSQQKMADAVGKYVDLGVEIDKMIDELITERQTVIDVIGQLKKPMEYDIIHKMYVGKIVLLESENENDATFDIRYMDFADFADLHNRTYSWATTIHGNALKNLISILEERGLEP